MMTERKGYTGLLDRHRMAVMVYSEHKMTSEKDI